MNTQYLYHYSTKAKFDMEARVVEHKKERRAR